MWDLLVIHLQEGWLFGSRHSLKDRTLTTGRKQRNLDKIQGCRKVDSWTKSMYISKGNLKIERRTGLWNRALTNLVPQYQSANYIKLSEKGMPVANDAQSIKKT